MACTSTITETEMRNHAILASALEKTGHEVLRHDPNYVRARAADGRSVTFSRSDIARPFATSDATPATLAKVQPRYTELAMRAALKEQGWNVGMVEDEQGNRKVTFIKGGG